MRNSISTAVLAACAGLACVQAANAQVFYSENFDGATLNHQSGDPRVTSACSFTSNPVFTHTPPTGWTWNACGVSTYACREHCGSGFSCNTCVNAGVREWEGWSFAKASYWPFRADNDVQNRSDFTAAGTGLASGILAVADNDEWDDKGSPTNNCGYYTAWMGTPSISLAGLDAGTLSFALDSSWRPEGFDDGANATNNQTAIIKAYYTVGGVEQPAVEVLHWDSDNGNNNAGNGQWYKTDATNEHVAILDTATDGFRIPGLQVPSGATAVRFEFGMVNAGNDWWWAIDNLVVTGGVSGQVTQLFSENFDELTPLLQSPIDEIPTGCGTAYCGVNTYTHDFPNGMSMTVASPASGGVPDYFGWTVMNRAVWHCLAENNSRRLDRNGYGFTNSTGLCAIADGDEYDDLSHASGPLDTTLRTPSIDVSSRTQDILVLTFDSSWRPESGQSVSVVAQYDTGETREVLRWESSSASEFFHGDAVNEHVALPLVVPHAASNVTLKFNYVGGNNWWWALDNLSLFQGQATVTVAGTTPSTTNMVLAPTIDYAPCFTPWSPTAPAGWTQDFQASGCAGNGCGRDEWRGFTIADKAWWSQIAGDQNRSLFTRASGFVAVADDDEWDDFANNRSNYNAFLTTPSIALSGSIASAALNFDSSWRPEGFDDACSCDQNGVTNTNNQTAMVKAIYTVGGVEQAPVTILHWDSDDGSHGLGAGFFHGDNENEAVSLSGSALAIPTGATAVRFEYSLTNARNDWWWAIDNVNFTVNGTTLFAEDFENAPDLQAPPTENAPVDGCKYFSTVAAQGGNLSVDNTGLITCNASGGDFDGFTAWVTNAWARALGGTRGQFSAPTAYVSDFAGRTCGGVTKFITPNYGINALNTDSLTLNMLSGWMSATGHTSTIEVSYDNGTSWTTVLSWAPSNKLSNPNEQLQVQLHNPAGATGVKLRFTDANSGYWAFSNLSIVGVVGTPSCPADFNHDQVIDFFDYLDFVDAFSTGADNADYNHDQSIDFFDYLDFVNDFSSGSC